MSVRLQLADLPSILPRITHLQLEGGPGPDPVSGSPSGSDANIPGVVRDCTSFLCRYEPIPELSRGCLELFDVVDSLPPDSVTLECVRLVCVSWWGAAEARALPQLTKRLLGDLVPSRVCDRLGELAIVNVPLTDESIALLAAALPQRQSLTELTLLGALDTASVAALRTLGDGLAKTAALASLVLGNVEREWSPQRMADVLWTATRCTSLATLSLRCRDSDNSSLLSPGVVDAAIALVSHPSLKSLTLRATLIDGVDNSRQAQLFAHALESSSLSSLTLEYMPTFDASTALVMEAVGRMPHLHELSTTGMGTGEVDDTHALFQAISSGLDSSGPLRKLRLSCPWVDAILPSVLADVIRATSLDLEELTLYAVRGNSVAAVAAAISEKHRLRSLDCTSTSGTKLQSIVRALFDKEHLRVLKLGCESDADALVDSVAELLAVSPSPCFQHLHFDRPPMSVSGLRTLSIALRQAPSLEQITAQFDSSTGQDPTEAVDEFVSAVEDSRQLELVVLSEEHGANPHPAYSTEQQARVRAAVARNRRRNTDVQATLLCGMFASANHDSAVRRFSRHSVFDVNVLSMIFGLVDGKAHTIKFGSSRIH